MPNIGRVSKRDRKFERSTPSYSFEQSGSHKHEIMVTQLQLLIQLISPPKYKIQNEFMTHRLVHAKTRNQRRVACRMAYVCPMLL